MTPPDFSGAEKRPLRAQVVAVARNGVIGADGDLAWRISDDLKRFKRITMGQPIVMGRKTYESIGKPLPGRANIVISRSYGAGGSVEAPDGVFGASSIEAALEAAEREASDSGAEEICIIGGAEIYAATLALTDRIYFTLVDAAPQGDALFPALDLSQWRTLCVGHVEKSEKNQHSCDFFILDRR